MIDTDKITTDRRSRTSSPSLPSLSTSSDISSIHARSTPKIAAGIIASVIAIACVIGVAFYFVSSEPTEPRSDHIKKGRIPSSRPQFISFDSQRRLDVVNITEEDLQPLEGVSEKENVHKEESTNETEKVLEKEAVNIPFFPTPVLRNHLQTKYTDGQDPEGPLQEKHGVYYRSRPELTTRGQEDQSFYISTISPTTSSTTKATALSKRSRVMIPPSRPSSNDFEPFIPYANLRGHNFSDFGARRRGFIRENINNPLVRRQNGLETISTLMDRRPGRLPFHPQGPVRPNVTSGEENTTSKELELRKGLISNIYQLVGDAKTEIDTPTPPGPRHPLFRRGEQQTSQTAEGVYGEHPESIFARFITKFRDRLTSSGPWGSIGEVDRSSERSFESGGDINHHSTSSLLFISLGILLMNALSGTKDGVSEGEEERSFQPPSVLEMDSILEGLMLNASFPEDISKYVQLLGSLRDMEESERPVGVDCIWQKYCTQLNSLAYSEDNVLRFVARLNSVGVKLIMSKIQGYELLSQFRKSYNNWQPIPCADIFKLCDPQRLSDLEWGS